MSYSFSINGNAGRVTSIFIVLLCSLQTRASHIVGGNISYQHLGANKYEITLDIYQDCYSGNNIAIQEDNPALLGIYNGDGALVLIDAVALTLQPEVVEPLHTDCGVLAPYCYRKARFRKTYELAPNSTGYHIVWQRCCRPHSINIASPDACGITFFCTIPAAITNSSAVFRQNPPIMACVANDLEIDHSATDADGDSLSYEFSPMYCGGTVTDAKPVPAPPPYQIAQGNGAFSFPDYLGKEADLSLNPTTGSMTARPNAIGHFDMAVACNEWRNGVKINTVRKEFHMIVTSCSGGLPPYELDTTIVAGTTLNFNAPANGQDYTWVPDLNLNDPTISNPSGLFSVTGSYTYLLYTTDKGGCKRIDTLYIDVVSGPDGFVPTAFTPNGDGNNDWLYPSLKPGNTARTFRVYNRWGNLVADNIAGWDGTYNGHKQNTDTYFWRLSYIDKNNRLKSMSGSSVLVR